MSQKGERVDNEHLIQISQIKIIISGILTALLLILEMYVIFTMQSDLPIIAIVGILLSASLYFLISSAIELNRLNKKQDAEKYKEIYRAQKASYLVIRKSFEELQERIEEIEANTSLPTSEIISAQKAMAKVTISRNKENADALLNSNDALVNQMFSFEEKLEGNNKALLSAQETLLKGTKDELLQKNQELLMKNQQLEAQFQMLKASLSGIENKMNSLESKGATPSVIINQAPGSAPMAAVSQVAPMPAPAYTAQEQPIMPQPEPEMSSMDTMDFSEDITLPEIDESLLGGLDEITADMGTEAEGAEIPEIPEMPDLGDLSEMAEDLLPEEGTVDDVLADIDISGLDLPEETPESMEIAPMEGGVSVSEIPLDVDLSEIGELPEDLVPDIAADETIEEPEIDLNSFPELASTNTVEDIPLEISEEPVEETGVEDIPMMDLESPEAPAAEPEPAPEPKPEPAPAAEPEPAPAPAIDLSNIDTSDPNKQLSPDEIAAMFAGAAGAAPAEEAPAPEPAPEPAAGNNVADALAGLDTSDPNKVMSAEEIQALFANL
ncbi:MAG: hypothetical protein K6A69_05430 [Lachnospiraceae bacterium]|nr:hypothetical protein [Lachnospiraceae bacterium]